MPTPAAPRTSPGRTLVTCRRVALALAAVLGLVLPVTSAQAAPRTSAEAATLVAAKGAELEALTENFNEARERLAAQTKAAQDAAVVVKKAQADLATAQEHVRGIARAAYTGEGQGSLRALMTSESADAFVDRVTTLQTIAGHQNGIVGEAATASVAAAQAQGAAVKSAADAQAQFDKVSAQQADLQSQIAEYQALHDRLSAQEQAAVAASVPAEHPGPAGRASRASRAEPVVSSGPIVANSQAAQIAVDTAMAQRGKSYVWAAAGPGTFDCSGLVQYAYAAAGIDLPHSSRMQAGMGQPVSRNELQPGDLVAFHSPVSHIGIYIGNGQMVHAPSTGDVVKVSPIDRVGGITAMTRIAG